VRDLTEQSLIDTEALIGRWHGTDRLGYAITPRFAPSCSDAQILSMDFLVSGVLGKAGQ
jgi:guanine deaminase